MQVQDEIVKAVEVDPTVPPEGQRCQFRGGKNCYEPAFHLYTTPRWKRWLCPHHLILVSESRHQRDTDEVKEKLALDDFLRYVKKAKKNRKRGRSI